MKPKFQKHGELKFVSRNEPQISKANNLKVTIGVLKFASRIIQSRYIGIGNYPTCTDMWDGVIFLAYLSTYLFLSQQP